MSINKKLGSKLAHGVRQVKSQRDPEPAVAPAKTAPLEKPAAEPTPASVAAKPVTPRAAQQPAASLDELHPRRIWPD